MLRTSHTIKSQLMVEKVMLESPLGSSQSSTITVQFCTGFDLFIYHCCQYDGCTWYSQTKFSLGPMPRHIHPRASTDFSFSTNLLIPEKTENIDTSRIRDRLTSEIA
jgi:hypothetical protein